MCPDKPFDEPNSFIFLEDINITHINDQYLADPCPARVVLHLAPRIMCRIESNHLPVSLAQLPRKVSCITIENGSKIQVMHSKNPFPKGFLVPYKSPCIVIQSNIKIRSISFSALNIPKFYGQKDRWTDIGGTCHRLGVAEMKHGGLWIEITEDPSLSRKNQQYGGYAVTHTGCIQRCDGGVFCVKEAEHILRGLRALLSFARGSACGLTLVKAVSQDGAEMILEWGTTYTKAWTGGDDTWLPTRDGGDSLSRLLPGFWNLYNDPDWKDTLLTVIDWYINSKDGPFHVGVILIQAALESLCHKISGVEGRKKIAAEEAFKAVGLCKKIPPSCKGLEKFSENSDGPMAIVNIRNSLVHPKKEDDISAEAEMEALRLGQWYIELLLLKQLDYRGRYMNRLKTSDEDPFEYVPWAKERRR